jgi:prevent-host-death family protein
MSKLKRAPNPNRDVEPNPAHRGAEEARNRLPELLTAAEQGNSTIITKRGRPVAALMPLDAAERVLPQESLLPLSGSGRGLWGKASRKTIGKLRDEWNR